MAPWIEQAIVGLIITAAVVVLGRRLFASFGSKKCGCDACPTQKKPTTVTADEHL